jgi:hypothetical protein
MRIYGFIGYHIYSSIWPGIKHHIYNIIDNTCWKLGKGDQINFWTDSWVGDPLVDLLNIPHPSHALLQAKAADFIYNDHWLIPHFITTVYPNLAPLLNNVTIPINKANDELRWIHSDSGVLSFKDAYLFHRPIGQHISWAKIIWCEDIPPSKSCLMWRVMHNRLPTDDLLSHRGCYIVSKCDLCGRILKPCIIFFVIVFLLRLFGIGLPLFFLCKLTLVLLVLFLMFVTKIGTLNVK